MNEPQADPGHASPPPSANLDRALALVEFLRSRCPWDARQTHRSLRRYLLEEAHEVVDAIDAGSDGELRDELGDLLLNLAFQVVVAEERGAFTREEVIAGLEEKMRRRHPHIYGDGDPPSWEAIKATERGDDAPASPGGLLGDLLPGADPLAHAHRVQARVASVGFDWPDASGAFEKVAEEVREVGSELATGTGKLEEELGDLLFAVVNLARLSGIHPTTALTRANRKFARRFARLEVLAAEHNLPLEGADLETLDRLWEEVKREER